MTKRPRPGTQTLHIICSLETILAEDVSHIITPFIVAQLSWVVSVKGSCTDSWFSSQQPAGIRYHLTKQQKLACSQWPWLPPRNLISDKMAPQVSPKFFFCWGNSLQKSLTGNAIGTLCSVRSRHVKVPFTQNALEKVVTSNPSETWILKQTCLEIHQRPRFSPPLPVSLPQDCSRIPCPCWLFNANHRQNLMPAGSFWSYPKGSKFFLGHPILLPCCGSHFPHFPPRGACVEVHPGLSRSKFRPWRQIGLDNILP